MPYVLPGNGVQSTLNGAILAGATSFVIQTTDIAAFNLPGDYPCVLFQNAETGPWEIVTVTGGQGTATLTVTRASEAFRGTQTALGWPSGTKVVPVLTRAMLVALLASGGVPDPLTLTTLHITGESITEAPVSDAFADQLSVPHGTVGRAHLAQNAVGDAVLWFDLKEPDGTIATDPNPRLTLAASRTSGQGCIMILGAFIDGQVGDVTQISQNNLTLEWLDKNGDGLHASAYIVLGSDNDYFPLFLDGELQRFGVNTDAPQATLHVAGDAIVDSTVTATGFHAATPPVVTGSRTDGTALASLLTALAGLGLITDSTTP